jgi:hypothetical protein
MAAGAVIVAGCGDLPLLEPATQRLPAGLTIEADRTLLTAGSTAGLRVVLRDQQGVAFDHLPPWSVPVWSTTDPAVLRVSDGNVEATSPGEALVRAQVAGHTASLRLRVNPLAVRLGMHAYLTQGAQRWDGTVPLVAGRDAVLRVFLSADQVNFFDPVVRVRFFRGGAETHTIVSQAKEGVPVEVAEGVLASSYNVNIPGAALQPGTAMAVEALTDGVVPLLGGSVIRFPASGQSAPLDVRPVAPFRIRFVPVVQPGTAAGNVTAGNVAQYMVATREVYPLGAVDVDVREPYSTSASTATEAGWSQILSEVRALRILDGETRYYHGIVRRLAHWAGLGYVSHPVAISYDALPAASWTVAHELGHNFGRFHAPCGNPSSIDNAFPHAKGGIGIYGLQAAQQHVYTPDTADLMGYCAPRWISDYTFLAVLAFRAAEAARAPAPSGPGLLVWGRIAADGQVTLEPPIAVARNDEPARGGPYRVEGRDDAGGVVFAADFAAEPVEDGAAGERHFAFTVPLDAGRAMRLNSLRVRGAGIRDVEVRAGAAPRSSAAASAQPRARSVAGRALELTWDAAVHPLVVVRDARTGRVLSLARGGRAHITSTAGEVVVEVSDGVRSTSRRVVVEPR